VDRPALDQPPFDDWGGFKRLNTVFDGQFETVQGNSAFESTGSGASVSASKMEMPSMSRSPTTTEPTAVTQPTLALPPIHPGEVLRDELDALHLSANVLARALDVPTNRVTEILNGSRGISADSALRLARYFGTSARFWMNLQVSYDLAVTEGSRGAAIAERVRPHAA